MVWPVSAAADFLSGEAETAVGPAADRNRIQEGKIMGNFHIAEVRTEYQVNPLGLDVAKPRFSWKQCC